MSMRLGLLFPRLDTVLGRLPIADLPTPVSMARIRSSPQRREIIVKRDDLSGRLYGGNKVRKLQYLLHRAKERGADRVVTFGAVSSNHALATALYAIDAGFRCTCLLSHQSLKPGLGYALRVHQTIGTDVVALSGSDVERENTIRRVTEADAVETIPVGGTSRLGTLGSVDAGLELAAQIERGECPKPARIYVALGTMGTAVGIALGLALAGLDIETHAVRVTTEDFANAAAAKRLMRETAAYLYQLEPSIPADIAKRTRLVVRHEFFGDGYGRSNPETNRAIDIAQRELALDLESTYTGKAMRALLADLDAGFDEPVLFWNTYNSRPLGINENLEPDFSVIPEEFRRYLDQP